MNILQFQILNTDEEELDIVPDFCNWLSTQIFQSINTEINRKKIKIRLNYLYNVPWISWKSEKHIDMNALMSAIYESLICEEHKFNTFYIKTDINVRIPNTYTSIDKIIKFLNYGDAKNNPINLFTNIQNEFNHNRLNSLWKLYINKELGYMSEAKIIAR